MAFALRSLALVVGQRPGFFQGRLPGKLIERVAQRFQASGAFPHFGIVATLEGHRSRPSQSLQARGISVAAAILANFRQQPRRQALARAWQTAEDLVVFMAQKKAGNLLVVVGDLLNQGASWLTNASIRRALARIVTASATS